MGNIINADILRQARGPNVGNTFNTILSSIGQTEKLKQQRETGAADRARRGLESIAIFGAQVSPMLETGDIEGAKATTLRRIAQLEQQGTSTDESRQFLNLLDSNPELAKQRAGQAVQLGQRLGVFSGQTGQTAGSRDFNNLIRIAQDPNSTQLEKDSARRELGDLARVSTSAAERIATDPNLSADVAAAAGEKQQVVGDIKTTQAGEQATITTRNKLRQETLAIPEQERVKFLSRNRERFSQDISESQNVLTDIDRAIEIWETAPGTISGPIAGRFPALADDTQELESILARLGVDRLANFKGATSERELATAFRAGASIEQNAVAGLKRLRKQRQDIERNNARLKGLSNESNALLRRQPQQPNVQDLSDEDLLNF